MTLTTADLLALSLALEKLKQACAEVASASEEINKLLKSKTP